jgi:hypothetical protein
MVLQVITPEKENFELPVSLPKSYLGKEVHCLFFIEEEAQNVAAPALSKKKPSDFFDIFNKQEGEKFDKHINQLRGEWDRNS